MTASTCFWSLLSLQDLIFLYVPSFISAMKIPNTDQSIQDLLLNRSLFEFIHPSELELARSDLSSFLKLQMLAGSVTRCRILSLKSIALHASKSSSTSDLSASTFNQPFKTHSITNDNEDDLSWDVVDLVIYTATNDTVLAFFHNIDLNFTSGNLPMTRISCSETGISNFVDQDAFHLIQALNLFKEKSSTKQQQEQELLGNRLDSSETSILNETIPLRVFQVSDQLTKTLLFTWPPLLPEFAPLINLVQSLARDSTLKEFKSSSLNAQNHPVLTGGSHGSRTGIALCNEQPSLENITCTRHYYSKTQVEAVDKQACSFQRILIPYGNIVFEVFQVAPIKPIKSTNSWSLYHASRMSSRDACGTTSFQKNQCPMMGRNIATRALASTFISAQLESSQQGQEDISITTLNTNSAKPFQVRVGEVEHMSSSNIESSSRIQEQQQYSQRCHYIFTADEYQGVYSRTSPSKKGSNKNFPDNKALFQKFRVQQHDHRQFQQQQQQQQQQHEPYIQTYPYHIKQHFGNQEYSNVASSSAEGRRAAFQQQRSDPTAAQENMKVCSRCRTSNSPEWRRGPDGHKTLCNACGLRYSRFRSKLWRANASPSTQ